MIVGKDFPYINVGTSSSLVLLSKLTAITAELPYLVYGAIKKRLTW